MLEEGSNEGVQDDEDNDASQNQRELLQRLFEHDDKLKFYYQLDIHFI